MLTVSDPIFALTDRPGRTQSAGFRAELMTRLRFAGRESDAIEREFPGQVDRLSRKQATERRVRDAIAGRRWLHFATHGLSGTGASLFAALALTPGARGLLDSTDDGLFELHEIGDMDLRGTDLTVLSACDTNVGPTVTGEGVFALARGFFSAGVGRVITTQWAVDDRSTAALIAHFFRSLTEHQRNGRAFDYVTALRDAKRYVATHGWADFSYWAPFVLYGAP